MSRQNHGSIGLAENGAEQSTCVFKSGLLFGSQSQAGVFCSNIASVLDVALV